MSNCQVIRLQVGQGNQLNLKVVELMWFQYMHNRDYHRDVHHMPTMKQIQHHANHLIKYSNVQFSEGSGNSKYKDTLACILSMCSVLGFNPFKDMECGGKFGNIDVRTYDLFAASSHFRNSLTKIIKAVEGFDHIEDIDYRKVITENLTVLFITTLTMAVFGYNGFNIVDELLEGKSVRDHQLDLLNDWYKQLQTIKQKNSFYKYFEEEHSRSKTSCYVHRCFL